MRRHHLHPPEPPPPTPPRAARPHRRLDHPSPTDHPGARERVLPQERADDPRPGACPRRDPARRAAGGARHRTLRTRHSEEDGRRRGGRAQGPGRRRGGATPQAEAGPDAGGRGGRRGGRAHPHPPRVIAQVSGRLAAKQADRVVVHTAGGVGYEIAVPLGVMEQLPPVGETVSLATELVVREDGWALYGFQNEPERRFFQRLIGVTGIGPKLAIALMSALGVERGARALQERNIALVASVSGIGKKTAESLALELADKLREFEEPGAGSAAAPDRKSVVEGGGGAGGG